MNKNVNTDRIYNFDTYVHAEVRKCEVVEREFEAPDGKIIKSKYLDLTLDDDDCNRFFLKDKIIDNQALYKRGAVGTFTLQIHVEDKFRGRTSVNVKKFVPDEE